MAAPDRILGIDITPHAFGLVMTWPQAWGMIVAAPLFTLALIWVVVVELEWVPARSFVQMPDDDRSAWLEQRTACVAEAMGFPAPPVHMTTEIGGWAPDHGGVAGYYDGRRVVVKLTRAGRVSRSTLAHELAHVADMGDLVFVQRLLRRKHGPDFAWQLRRVYGAMVHCEANREKPEGWDGRPQGTTFVSADDYHDVIPEDACKPGHSEDAWLRI